MKTCPVCHASAFDDAPICFGCLHDFNDGVAVQSVPHDVPPEFRIRFTPIRELSGTFTWRCAVETA